MTKKKKVFTYRETSVVQKGANEFIRKYFTAKYFNSPLIFVKDNWRLQEYRGTTLTRELEKHYLNVIDRDTDNFIVAHRQFQPIPLYREIKMYESKSSFFKSFGNRKELIES